MPAMIDSYSESNHSEDWSLFNGSDIAFAQSSTGDGKALSSCKWLLKKVASPSLSPSVSIIN